MKEHMMIIKLLHVTPTKTQPTTAKLITWRKVGKEKGLNHMIYNLREKQLSGNTQKSESTDFSRLNMWLDVKKKKNHWKMEHTETVVAFYSPASLIIVSKVWSEFPKKNFIVRRLLGDCVWVMILLGDDGTRTSK